MVSRCSKKEFSMTFPFKTALLSACQVVAKETEYMPSFHGGYYRDQLNVQDLMFGQKNNKELQVM